MTTKKGTKQALLTSVLALLLCMSMLIGTTFAWFTDDVTSGNNIIQSGTLDAELLYSDDNTNWNDASKVAIFDYKYWEPGYTQVKYVKVVNAGNLAFKYQLKVIPNVIPAEGDVNLADVIDVYAMPIDDVPDEGLSREYLKTRNPIGTLTQLMQLSGGDVNGVLLPKEGAPNVNEDDAPVGEVGYCIILKMQEDAGNEYQNRTVAEGFRVQLLATQYTWEEDSFDHLYDEDAKVDNEPLVPEEELTDVEVFVYDYFDAGDQYPASETMNLDFTQYIFNAALFQDNYPVDEYADWTCDYFVSSNEALNDGLILVGQYDAWSTSWIGFRVPASDEPYEPIGLLGAATNGGESNWTYKEICEGVQIFKCGLIDHENKNIGTEITVELRMTSPDKSEYKTVCSITVTLP